MNSSITPPITPFFQQLNAFTEYNGKRVYCKINKYVDSKNNTISGDHCFVTSFNKEKYSPYPKEGGTFNITSEQRNCFNSTFFEDTVNGKNFLENHKMFEENLTNNEIVDIIFQNNQDTYKDKKGKIMFQYEDNVKEKKYQEGCVVFGCRLNFRQRYFLHYNDEILDEDNRKKINDLVFPKNKPALKGDALKKYKNTLNFTINYPQGTANTVKLNYETDIKEKKGFIIKIIYREVVASKELKGLHDGVWYVHENVKRPDAYTNSDFEDEEILNKFVEDYGPPQFNGTLNTPEEVEKFAKPNSYYRYGIPYEFWADKPIAKKIVSFGVRAFCDFVEIIYIKEKFNDVSKKNNDPINQLYKNNATIFNTSKLLTNEKNLLKSPNSSDEKQDSEKQDSEKSDKKDESEESEDSSDSESSDSDSESD
jgi:hypothetical protein